MSEAKFTPGQWKHTREPVYPGCDIASWGEVEVAPKRRIIVEGATQEEAEANAHLIAAAPAMYEALEKARGALHYSEDCQEWVQDEAKAAIDDALRAARGEEAPTDAE